MKRFHVHLTVDDLDTNIAFYSQLFGQAPTRQETDYAKWMLEDPRVNFAISARGHGKGVNHFGIQADSAEELGALRRQAEAASGGQLLDEGETTCCYARSDKHWVTDPQGMPWEHYVTMGSSVTFGDTPTLDDGACCVPTPAHPQPAEQSACCAPAPTASGSKCCG
jgi:catechol 2,3-dioxygenase-like lactoylglutathione lyase family enzyme